jgi:hypothetical protein
VRKCRLGLLDNLKAIAGQLLHGHHLEPNPWVGLHTGLAFVEVKEGLQLCTAVHDPRKVGVAGRRLASILDEAKLRRVLATMLDENEFLSPYGLRLSPPRGRSPTVVR